MSQVYADKNKVAGVNIDDPQEKQKIYQRYLQAFKKGVYNYIKEEPDLLTQQVIPRKYFSGGVNFDFAMNGETNLKSNFAMEIVHNLPASTSDDVQKYSIVSADLAMFSIKKVIDRIFNRTSEKKIEIENKVPLVEKQAINTEGQESESREQTSYGKFKEWLSNFSQRLVAKEGGVAREEVEAMFRKVYGRKLSESRLSYYLKMLAILNDEPAAAYEIANWKVEQLEELFRIFDALNRGVAEDPAYKKEGRGENFIEKALLRENSGFLDNPEICLDRMLQKIKMTINDSSVKLAIKLDRVASINAARGLIREMGIQKENITLYYDDEITNPQSVETVSPGSVIKQIRDFKKEKIQVGFRTYGDISVYSFVGRTYASAPNVPLKFDLPEKLPPYKINSIKKSLGISLERKVMVVGSPRMMDELDEIMQAYDSLTTKGENNETLLYRDLPAGQRPLVILAFRVVVKPPDLKARRRLQERYGSHHSWAYLEDSLKHQESNMGIHGVDVKDSNILVVDTMGDLPALYNLGTVNVLGHDRNVAEPAVTGVPTLVLPGDWGNNIELKTELEKRKAIKNFSWANLQKLMESPAEAKKLGEKGSQVVEEYRSTCRYVAEEFVLRIIGATPQLRAKFISSSADNVNLTVEPGTSKWRLGNIARILRRGNKAGENGKNGDSAQLALDRAMINEEDFGNDEMMWNYYRNHRYFPTVPVFLYPIVPGGVVQVDHIALNIIFPEKNMMKAGLAGKLKVLDTPDRGAQLFWKAGERNKWALEAQQEVAQWLSIPRKRSDFVTFGKKGVKVVVGDSVYIIRVKEGVVRMELRAKGEESTESFEDVSLGVKHEEGKKFRIRVDPTGEGKYRLYFRSRNQDATLEWTAVPDSSYILGVFKELGKLRKTFGNVDRVQGRAKLVSGSSVVLTKEVYNIIGEYFNSELGEWQKAKASQSLEEIEGFLVKAVQAGEEQIGRYYKVNPTALRTVVNINLAGAWQDPEGHQFVTIVQNKSMNRIYVFKKSGELRAYDESKSVSGDIESINIPVDEGDFVIMTSGIPELKKDVISEDDSPDGIADSILERNRHKHVDSIFPGVTVLKILGDAGDSAQLALDRAEISSPQQNIPLSVFKDPQTFTGFLRRGHPIEEDLYRVKRALEGAEIRRRSTLNSLTDAVSTLFPELESKFVAWKDSQATQDENDVVAMPPNLRAELNSLYNQQKDGLLKSGTAFDYLLRRGKTRKVKLSKDFIMRHGDVDTLEDKELKIQVEHAIDWLAHLYGLDNVRIQEIKNSALVVKSNTTGIRKKQENSFKQF